jgi:2,3-bisphosphoglycerate-dependent phosphoglycerate mutase
MLKKLNRTLFFAQSRLVIIRHGETQSNKHKQWSGWYDSKLSKKGEEESSKCGRLLV